ncbi:MAG: hypothetical protein QME49_03410, partial [bacterium]|nr:hypothetical protein [bacterium]
VSVTPSSGIVGTSVIVRGNGYGISEDVRIRFGTNQTITTVSGNEYGSWTATFTVDTQGWGVTTITAYKTLSPIASSEIAFTIIANNQLGVTPISGTVGTSITINGSGFGANENIRVGFGTNVTYTWAQATGAGTFSGTFYVDNQKRGNTLIKATGSSTAQEATGNFSIQPEIIGFTPTIGTVGTIVTVRGSGCAYPDTLGIDFGVKTDITTINTTEFGSFTTTFTVDTQVYGTTTATISTNNVPPTGYTEEQLIKTFFIQQAWVILTPNTGTIGTSIIVAGNGFAGNEGIVVSFGTNQTITTTNAASNGSWTAMFTADVQCYGPTLITARGTSTQVSITDNFTIQPQIVSSLPIQGTVGTVITIVANGYGSETVKITYGLDENNAYAGSMTVNTSQYGSFTTYFTVNTQTYGTKTVFVRGQATNQLRTSSFKITPQATLTPTQGSVGTSVTINGNGFTGPESLTVIFGKTTLAISPTTQNNTGVILANNVFAVDEQPYGDTHGTVTGGASQHLVNFPGTGFKILANLWYVQPTQGTVGTMISVSGNGFKKSDTVDIKFGNTNIVQSYVNGYGTFTTSFTIDTQAFGITSIKGIQTGEDLSVKTITILPAIVNVNPSSGPVGLTVTVTGNGYPANNNLRVEFGVHSSIAFTTSADNGSFTVLFIINTQPAGTTTIKVWDSGNTISAASTFKIGGRLTRVSPNTGSVGTVVTLEGDGFGSPDGLRVDFGSSTLGYNIKSLSISRGTFTTTFTVNTQRYGTTTITVIGTQSNATAQDIFNIIPNIINVAPLSGTVGSQVTVSGNGFVALEEISLQFGDFPGIVTGSATDTGSFTLGFTVNTQGYGTTNITVKDIVTQTRSAATSTYRIMPRIIEFTPTAGTVGCLVNISGNGYGAGSTVRIMLGTAARMDTQASSGGSFTTTFTIDTQGHGATTVIATGTTYFESDNRSFSIQPAIWQVTPSEGTVGATISIRGNGYAANTVINVWFGSRVASITTTNTDASGSWTTTFTIDTQVYGTTSLLAKGAGNESATNTVKILSRIVLVSPGAGTVGSSVEIAGNGYKAGEIIYIDFGTDFKLPPSNIYVTSTGSFTRSFVVTTQPYGQTIVTGYIEFQGNKITSATSTFAIQPNIISVIPAQGTVGSSITVAGNGYTASSTISIDFGNAVPITSGSSTTEGSFTISFSVNLQAYGTKIITARGPGSDSNEKPWFTIIPNIRLVTPTSGTVGSQVSVEGDGYGAGEPITVKFGTNPNIVTPIASADGLFVTQFTVDTQPYSTKDIVGYGNNTQQSATSTAFGIQANIIEFAPTKGTVGTILTIKGTGFKVGTVKINVSKHLSAKVVAADERGYFDTTLSICEHSYGTTTVKAISILNIPSIERLFRIIPNIYYVSPLLGTIGTVVEIRGNGYGFNEQIEVNFGTTFTIATAMASNEEGVSPFHGGTFATTFTVNKQQFGTTTITAWGVTTSNDSGSNTFKIRARMFDITPINGTIGSWVTIKGDGYKAGETIWVDFGSTQTITQGTVATEGSFTIGFTVDTQPGTITVSAVGIISGEIGTQSYVVMAEITSVSPKSGTVGTMITVSGGGYGPAEWMTIDFGQTKTMTVSTGNNGFMSGAGGTFSVTFTINLQPYGLTTIVVKGETSGHVDEGTLTIMPKLTIVSPKSGTVGSTVAITGNGYAASEGIDIVFGTRGTITVCTASGIMTDKGEGGTWTVSFTVNEQPYGTSTIIAWGKSSFVSYGSPTQNWGVTPEQSYGTYTYKITEEIIRYSPTRGTVGNIVTVSGNGFGNTERINIDFGNKPTITFITTNIYGTFTVNFTIDAQPWGTKTVAIKSIQTGLTKIKLFFIDQRIVSIMPISGTVGTQVTVTGDGYLYDQETGAADWVFLRFGGTQKMFNKTGIDSVDPIEDGSFQFVFTVNRQPMGATLVKSYANESETERPATTTFSILPQIIITPLTGPVGTLISVYGDGYKAAEGIHINFGTHPTITLATTDSMGTFGTTFTADVQPAGATQIRAYGLTSGSSTYATFTIGNLITVSPTIGTVGLVVELKGNGFIANTPINISFGRNGSIKGTTTIGDGSFVDTFTIDTQPLGTTTISATDGASTMTTIFIIKPNIISVTPSSATVGAWVTVAGNGYAYGTSGETVAIHFGNKSTITQTVVSYYGSWTTSFTIDTQVYGTTTITGYGTLSTWLATSTIRIYPNIITVTPDNGTVGCLIAVAGNGFGNLEYIRINFGTTVSRGTTTAASNGSWTTFFTINTQQYGTTTVEAAGLTTPIKPARTLKILPKVILVSPFSGIVGATITVGGNGFGASSSIRIKFGLNNTITTVTSDNRGSFTKTFIIDLQSYGTKTVTVYDDTLVAFGVEATSMAKILQKVVSITPTTGTVGTLMTVSGNGYGTNESIRIEFGTTKTMGGVANPTTDTNGSFTCSFVVDTQVYGSTSVIAWSDTLTASEGADVQSYKDFKITQILITVTPTAGTVGAEITVAGNGFGNAEVISIQFGNTLSMGTTSTEDCGSWTTTFTINTQRYGITTITASGSTTGVEAIGTISIQPNIISITPTTGTVGAWITVAGNGFDNAEVISLHLGITSNIVTCSAVENGSWTTQFTIDTQMYGTTTITVHGATTPIKPEGTLTILPKVILVSPFSGTVGTTITVGGNGFGASNSIRIKFGTNNTITNITSDDKGSWTTTFTIDLQFYGTKTITAYDTVIGSPVEATNRAKILPKVLSITPTNGTVGTMVNIRGNGYGSSESVRIAFGTTPTRKTVTSNNVGSWTTTFSIDTQSYGTTSVVAWSDVLTASEGFPVNSYIDFKIDQIVTMVTPKSGTVGAWITVYGNGFGKTETIRIFFGTRGSSSPIVTTITEGCGSFTTQFTIDTQVYGTTTIEAKGTATNVSAYGSITIQSNIISITPKSGTVGSVVTVRGNGFGSTESIRIHFGSTSSIVLTTSVANGSWTTFFTINTQGYGTTTITADGVNTPIKPIGTFTILPRVIYTSPLSGTVGTEISIRGNGFGRSETINIQFGTTAIVSTQATNLGSWTISFTIDTQVYGTTTITASGAETNVLTTSSVKIIQRIISISTGTATVSTVVTVRGDGYGANEPIRINFGTTQSIAECVADENGWFETTFTVNSQAYGNRTIKATGRNTNVEDTKPFFIIGRVYEITPTTGTVGCVVTVKGDGYDCIEWIAIYMKNNYGQDSQIRYNMAGVMDKTSSNGTFSIIFTINNSPYGSTTIKAWGVNSSFNA